MNVFRFVSTDLRTGETLDDMEVPPNDIEKVRDEAERRLSSANRLNIRHRAGLRLNVTILRPDGAIYYSRTIP
jgi:hypothetical protein